MSDFVLDCSVSAAWCFEDEAEGYADSVLGTFTSKKALVPQLWLLELGNVLAIAERQNRINQKETVHFMSLIRSLPIQVVQWLNIEVAQSILDLARNRALSMYDANYLWVAMEEDLALATLDGSLREACEDVGVEVYQPN